MKFSLWNELNILRPLKQSNNKRNPWIHSLPRYTGWGLSVLQLSRSPRLHFLDGIKRGYPDRKTAGTDEWGVLKVGLNVILLNRCYSLRSSSPTPISKYQQWGMIGGFRHGPCRRTLRKGPAWLPWEKPVVTKQHLHNAHMLTHAHTTSNQILGVFLRQEDSQEPPIFWRKPLLRDKCNLEETGCVGRGKGTKNSHKYLQRDEKGYCMHETKRWAIRKNIQRTKRSP